MSIVEDQFRHYRNRLLIIFSLGILILASVMVYLNNRLVNFGLANADISYIINISGRQRMLSQNIAKSTLIFANQDYKSTNYKLVLDSLTNQFKNAHQELLGYNQKIVSKKLDSLFITIEPSYLQLIKARNVLESASLGEILKQEAIFLPIMDKIVKEYELIGDRVMERMINSNTQINYVLTILLGAITMTIYLLVIDVLRKLYQSKAQLKKSLRVQSRFTYVASHELQEPTVSILGLSQLLLKEYRSELDNEALKLLNFINKSALRLRMQMNGLLQYTRLGESNKKEKMDLNAVIEGIKQELYDSIVKTKTVFVYSNLPEVTGFPDELRLLFFHLIENAIKYRDLTREPVISIMAVEQKKYWLFQVKDNGIGIREKDHDKIFYIFKSLNNPEKYPGIGIGLALCSRIAEIHQGKIWIESEFGQGSNFFFLIKK